jgi:inner membrane transporter RhtA
MVLGGVVALEGGATIARKLFSLAGVPGTVALRLSFGALLLAVRRRPAVPAGRRQLALTAAVGITLAAHHITFYAAVARLPLGIAVTLEFCGPLAVALLASRRLSHLLWTLLAGAGVLLASGIGVQPHWNLLGIMLALAAGGCWALYIVVFPRVGQPEDRGAALTTVTVIAAVTTLPYGIAADHAGIFTPEAIGLGVLIALLADATAYSLQAHALARLSRRVFSVLSSTEPAVGALLGLTALGQHIHPLQWIGIAAVSIASAATSLQP